MLLVNLKKLNLIIKKEVTRKINRRSYNMGKKPEERQRKRREGSKQQLGGEDYIKKQTKEYIAGQSPTN